MHPTCISHGVWHIAFTFSLYSVLCFLVLHQAEASAAAATDDSDDPEIQFLRSLTPKQKKKLLKYVFLHFCTSVIYFCDVYSLGSA